MKLKGDFVTNSSSSSFVVIGAYVTSDMIADKSKDIHEDIDEILEGTNLNYSHGPDGYGYADGIYVGIEYTDMEEDETLRQFKERVTADLKKAFGTDMQVGHIELAWEDR